MSGSLHTLQQTLLLVSACLFIRLERVRGLQRFMSEPRDVDIIQGRTVILPCFIQTPQGPVQWTVNEFGLGHDRSLPGWPRYSMVGNATAGEYNLQIINVQEEDDAIFQCQVGPTQQSAGMRSRNAKLNVLIAPSNPQIVQGSEVQVTADLPVNLTCRANGGKPAAELTWHDHSGTPIKDEILTVTENIPNSKRVNTVHTVTIIPSKEHAGRAFTCLMYHKALSAARSEQVQLDVRYKPVLRITVTPYGIREYDNVVIHCQATANPTSIEYEWYRNGVLLDGEKGHKLRIYNINRGYHDNKIMCKARNEIGISEQEITLEMKYGPKFLSLPASVAVDLHKDATLYCEADGNPRPTIVWFRPGMQVLTSTPSMTIEKVDLNKAGKYICAATVPSFADVSAEVNIYIKGPPKITSPKLQTAPEGETGRVECVVEGVPLPKSIRWARGNHLIDFSDDRFTIRREDYESSTKSYLTIANTHGDDYGQYNCSVSNGYGQDQVVITLEKESILPLPYLIGGIVGGIVLIIIIAIGIVLCNRKRHVSEDDESNYSEKSRGRSNVVALTDYKPGTLTGSLNPRDMWPPDGRDTYYRVNTADYSEPTYMQKPDNRMNNNGFLHIDDYIHDYGSSQNYVRQPSYRLSNNSLAHPTYVFSAPPAERTYGTYDDFRMPPGGYVDETLNPNRLSTRV